MGKKSIWLAGGLIVILAVVVIIVWQARRPKVAGAEATAQAAAQQPVQLADPQKLLIPRWFLSSIESGGSTIQVPEQTASIKFEPGGKAGGIGGCNEFSTSYEAGADGRMSFGPVMSTAMACDKNMEIEKGFYEAMPKIGAFAFDGSKLVLSSLDGKTKLVFIRPPK